MRRLPIRFRIALLVAGAAAVVASSIGGLALSRSGSAIAADFDTSLGEEAAEAYVAVVGGLPLGTFHLEDSSFVERVGLFNSAGELVDHTLPEPPPAPGNQPSGEYTTVTDPVLGEELRLVTLPVEYQGSPHTLVMAIPTRELDERFGELQATVALAVVAFTILAGIGAYFVTGFVLNPIDALRESAMQLAVSPNGRRLPVPESDDEVKGLAESFNEVLARIEEMMERQQRFLAEASHELRTPIARLRADIELARRPIRTPDELLDSLGRIDNHAQHLTSLADSLLGMLTVDHGAKLPNTVPLQTIADGLRDRSAYGESIHLTMSESDGSRTMDIDANLLISVLANLVDNAFRHGEPPVEVAIRPSEDVVEFTVRDHGQGIEKAFHGEVIKPFGRGTAPTSGSGLGLSVVSTFATNAGGELVIEHAEPGCRMVLRLPA